MALLNSHAECGKRWNGTSLHHCCGCHEHFSSLSAFDHHRDGSHAKGRFCREPGAVGLELKERVGYTVWGFPGDGQDWFGNE